MASADNGYYKLSWGERIGFNSGELAQNLIYQTVSIWLLFYYNNVFGLDAAVVAMLVMFLFVSIPSLKSCFPLLCVVQFVKSTGVLVATGYKTK